MKVCAVSDIHVDINKKRKSSEFSRLLIKYIKTVKPELLLITGDIAGNTTDLLEFFELSTDIEAHKLFVPGNHDIWVNQESKNLSWLKYNEVLPKLCSHYGWHYLPENPIIIEEIGFVGCIGWYDYSLRNKIWDNVYTKEVYEDKVEPEFGLSWMDKFYVKFGSYSDAELTEYFLNKLKIDIQNLRHTNSDLTKLVIGTHMVPFVEFVEYRGLIKYDFFTAYYGSKYIGEFIKSLPVNLRITSIFGQMHLPNSKKLARNITAHCVPIGYPREYGRHIPLQRVFMDRVKVMDL